MSNDLITVALPVFNNEKTVEVTIKSIIFQTYQNWELIVVDDASTDSTAKIVKKFKDKRIKIVRHSENKHIAATLNEIIDKAKGKYFARIDGDDYCYPKRFEVQLSYMKKHPKIDLVGCNLIVVDKNGRLLGKRNVYRKNNNVTHNPYSNIYLPHPSFFGKIEFFRKYKYRRPPVTAQDQDLLLRAFEESKFANVNQILVCYQETLNVKKIFWARVDLLKSRYMFKGANLKFFKLLVNQLIKICIDSMAVFSNLNYIILRHRAKPVSLKEKQEWQEVKSLLGI